MHEMALSESILKVMQDQAVSQKFKRVETVYLELGELACVTPEAILFCFDVVTKDSLADGAKLKISRSPGEALCMNCNQHVKVGKRGQPCPECSSYQLRITAGEDMWIKELEVE